MLFKNYAIGCLMIPIVFAAIMLFATVGVWLEKRSGARSTFGFEVVVTAIAVLMNLAVAGAWLRILGRPGDWKCMGYSRGFWLVLMWLAYGLGIGFGCWLLIVAPA